MKRNTLIICSIASILTLTAFKVYLTDELPNDSIKAKNQTAVKLKNDFFNTINKSVKADLNMMVNSRFRTTINKQQLRSAKSILDLLPKEEVLDKKDFRNVKIQLFNEDNYKLVRREEVGENEKLNDPQVELLHSIDYSENFFVSSMCQRINPINQSLQNYELRYFITVVPEIEVAYEEGKESLLFFLEQGAKESTKDIDRTKLESGQISFVISKDAKVTDVQLNSSSAFSELDERLIELLRTTSGKWTPAMNSRGKKIEQELILFFGTMGC